MSAFSPAQWARAGEEACRLAMAAVGLIPTAVDLADARDAAVHIACGIRINSAIPGRECGEPSGQVANSPHAGSGPPRGGCESPAHGTGEGSGHD